MLFVACETKSFMPTELGVRSLTYRKFDAMELRVRCDGTFSLSLPWLGLPYRLTDMLLIGLLLLKLLYRLPPFHIH